MVNVYCSIWARRALSIIISSMTIINYFLHFTFCRFQKDPILVAQSIWLTNICICIKVLSLKSITDPCDESKYIRVMSLKSIWMKRWTDIQVIHWPCHSVNIIDLGDWNWKLPRNTSLVMVSVIMWLTGRARVSNPCLNPIEMCVWVKNLANSLWACQ